MENSCGDFVNVDEDQSAVLLRFVVEFQKIQKPEIKDLSSLLISFIKFFVENKRLGNLEEEVSELEVELHKHKLEISNNKIKLEALDRKISTEMETLNNMIKDLSGKFENLNSENEKSMSTINILLQSKIDNDIIIRGFPDKPESEIVRDNFVKYFNIDKSEVLSHYYFPYTSRFSGKTSHNVIITTYVKNRPN
jgi:hypothetical protein